MGMRQFQPQRNFTEDNIPEKFKLRVHHLHCGNSTHSDRLGHEYVTIAQLFDRETGELITEGKSFCSKRDVPNKKVGRMVAVGRALKEYYLPSDLPPF